MRATIAEAFLDRARSCVQCARPSPRDMPVDAPLGCVLRFGGTSRSGEQASFSWKAYTDAERPERLRWELRRMLTDVGYSTDNPKRASKHLTENWDRWCGYLQRAGFDSNEFRCLSRKALVARGALEVEVCASAQETWLSTEALMALMQAWATERRAIAIRERVDHTARLFVERTIPAEACGDFDAFAPPEHVLVLCRAEPRQNGMCACFVELLHGEGGPPDTSGCSPQAAIWARLKYLYVGMQCASVRQWVRSLIVSLAGMVRSSMQDWGDFGWHQASDAVVRGKHKARRIDEHLKVWVTQKSVTDGQMSTPAVAARVVDGGASSSSVRWVHTDMAAFQASLRLCFREPPSSMSLAMDAARIGMPGVEYLMICASDLQDKRHAVLPPQVALCTAPTYQPPPSPAPLLPGGRSRVPNLRSRRPLGR